MYQLLYKVRLSKNSNVLFLLKTRKMVMCFAPTCKHYSEKHGCTFFSFPKDQNELRRWIKLIRREDRSPGKHSRMCRCHFVDGNKKNGPTIFETESSSRKPSRRKQLLQQQEGQIDPISFQTVDTVPHDHPEFVDALTIKEEALRDDFSENFDVKQEPIEDPLESRIEPPTTLNSRSVEEFPLIKQEETDSRDLDPVDSMFLDFARRFKLFSARTQIGVNSRIRQVFAEAEMEEFEQKQRQSQCPELLSI